MIDCFVSTLDRGPNRIAWSRETISCYLSEPELRVTILDAGSDPEQLEWFKSKDLVVVPQPTKGSVFRRFLLAEVLSESELFILSDNDVKPVTNYWLPKMLEVAQAHPQFGYTVCRMKHCDFPGNSSFENAEIRGIQVGGGLGLIRKDARTAPFRVPPIYYPEKADDKCYCEAMRQSKSNAGMFLKVYIDHVGRGESTAGLYDRVS